MFQILNELEELKKKLLLNRYLKTTFTTCSYQLQALYTTGKENVLSMTNLKRKKKVSLSIIFDHIQFSSHWGGAGEP